MAADKANQKMKDIEIVFTNGQKETCDYSDWNNYSEQLDTNNINYYYLKLYTIVSYNTKTLKHTSDYIFVTEQDARDYLQSCDKEDGYEYYIGYLRVKIKQSRDDINGNT